MCALAYTKELFMVWESHAIMKTHNPVTFYFRENDILVGFRRIIPPGLL